MAKLVSGIMLSLLVVGVVAWKYVGVLMFNETESPFDVEEIAERIQHNIQETLGWALSGLRNPARAIESKGGNTLPVLLVDTCNAEYQNRRSSGSFANQLDQSLCRPTRRSRFTYLVGESSPW